MTLIAKTDGTVWSTNYRNTGKTMQIKAFDNGRGYLSFVHSVGGKKKLIYVHRLVAQTHVPNPDSLPTVNHINGNKRDNRASNLEWLSYSENHKHSYKELGRKHYNKTKTHCKRGHKFTKENTYTSVGRSGVQRKCRSCALQKDTVGQI